MVQDSKTLKSPPRSKKASPQYWRWLLAPMLLVSVGLHGLVLFTPVGPSDDDLLPPPDPEEDGIAITKIDAPTPRVSTPPTNAGTVKTAPQTQTAARPSGATTASRRSSGAAQGTRSNSQSSVSSQRSRASGTSAQPQVPDLSDVPSADNPNPPNPDVGRSTSGIGRTPGANTASGPTPFEQYIAVFAEYNGVKVSDEDAAAAQMTWLESFSDRGAEFTNLEIEPLDGLDPLPYEANICLPSAPRKAQLLVLVDAEGTVDPYQPFVQRTGYRNFDNAAADQIRQYSFPDTDEPKAYLAEVSVDYDADGCEWPPDVDKVPAEYFAVLDQYVGPDLTTPRDAKAAQERWIKSLEEAENVDLPSEGELMAEEFEDFEPEVPYPVEICLPIEPKDAEWGVVVNPDGSLVNEPFQIRSTGYQNFDETAKELVSTFEFPEAESVKLYVIEVEVDYNSVNCQPTDSDSFEVSDSRTTAANADPGNPSASGGSPESDPAETTGEAIAFDPAQQTQLIDNGREQIEAYPAGSLNTQLEIAAASLQIGWPEDIDQSCFLADISETSFVPVEAAADALILSENSEFVPLTLGRAYQVEPSDAGEYCGALLLQMTVVGTPQLYASIVPFGSGGSNTLVVLWTADPREQ
ncbi:MAG: hypothetical protein ACFBSG_02845 [Leptolyngbyaceae cyanobacterium]